jgi:Tfp pilus assembly protein PilZ
MPSLEKAKSRNDRRRHPRIACHIPVDYVIQARFYKDFIENISYGGALIETPEAFLPGQEVAIAFAFPVSGYPIKGVAEIVWIRPGRFGVKFKSLQLRGKELQFNHSAAANESSAIIKKEARKMMGRIKKKKILWEASSSPDVVSYRIYWSKCGEVSYSSEHAELGKRTEVILPDHVPNFPLIATEMEVGITAINEAGNESEMIALKAYFNFAVPAPPSNLQVEDA